MLLKIIDYQDVLDVTFETLTVGPVKFLMNFGPWEEGEEVGNLTLFFDDGNLVEHDDRGGVARSCWVEIVETKD